MIEHLAEGISTVIRKRQVYYLSGFDPRGARFYHQLFREEAGRQAALIGVQMRVGPRVKTGDHAVTWQVEVEGNGQKTVTRHSFLAWDDIIREHWPASIWTVIGRLPRFYMAYALTGTFTRLWGRSKRMVATLLTPLVLGLFAGTVAALIVWSLPAWLGLPLSAIFLWGAAKLADRWQLIWLSRIYLFVHFWARGGNQALDDRWRVLAKHIDEDMASNPDAEEVLVIGHSIGCMAGVAVLGELLKAFGSGEGNGRFLAGKLRFITLAHSIPVLSFFPTAAVFRERAQVVAGSSVPWLDISAPIDPLCMALSDPLAGSGSLVPRQARVIVRSARFDRMFAPDKYKALVRDAFRIHFQYLMSTDLPVWNDYFSITAGHKPLSHWMEPRP